MSQKMNVVYGGCYREICIKPHHNQLMGSGLRACLVLQQVAKGISHTWYTWLPSSDQVKATALLSRDSLNQFTISNLGGAAMDTPCFHYINPLAPPRLEWTGDFRPSDTHIEAESALVFGTLENRPRFSANVAVFDPQNPNSPDVYFDNGSVAQRCALVLNHKEAAKLASNRNIYETAKLLQQYLLKAKNPKYEVVVIKMAHAGCWVCTSNDITSIPAYRTDKVFSIGSGDVFSAAFYAKWALEGSTPRDAADFASKITSIYCGSGIISPELLLQSAHVTQALSHVTPETPTHVKRIYLAAPFFDQGQIALVEHIRDCLTTPWTQVFSPLHDVGYGGPKDVYGPDIQGIEECDIVFAVLSGLDTGTIFEVGYATKIPKPVFCLAEGVAESDLTMILGSGATVETDISTAIYKALWATLD